MDKKQEMRDKYVNTILKRLDEKPSYENEKKKIVDKYDNMILKRSGVGALSIIMGLLYSVVVRSPEINIVSDLRKNSSVYTAYINSHKSSEYLRKELNKYQIEEKYPTFLSKKSRNELENIAKSEIDTVKINSLERALQYEHQDSIRIANSEEFKIYSGKESEMQSHCEDTAKNALFFAFMPFAAGCLSALYTIMLKINALKFIDEKYKVSNETE